MTRAWGVAVPFERIQSIYSSLLDSAIQELLDAQLLRIDLPPLRHAILEAAHRSTPVANISPATWLAGWAAALTQAPPHLGLVGSERGLAHSYRCNVSENQRTRTLEFTVRMEVPEHAYTRRVTTAANSYADAALRPQRLAISFPARRDQFIQALHDPGRHLVVQERVSVEQVDIGGRVLSVPGLTQSRREYQISAGGVELPASLVMPNAERWLRDAVPWSRVPEDLGILTAALVAMDPVEVGRFHRRLPEVLRYRGVAIDCSTNVSDPSHPGAVVYLYGLSEPQNLPAAAVPLIWPNGWGPRPSRVQFTQQPMATVTIQDGGNERKSEPTKARYARPVRRLNLSRETEDKSNVPHDEHFQRTDHVDQRLARRRRGASLKWYVDPDEHQ